MPSNELPPNNEVDLAVGAAPGSIVDDDDARAIDGADGADDDGGGAIDDAAAVAAAAVAAVVAKEAAAAVAAPGCMPALADNDQETDKEADDESPIRMRTWQMRALLRCQL